MTSVSRGDIVYVNFPDDPPDAEFDDPHPAVVLQSDSENEQLDSTVVIPVTSGSDPHPLREVYLPAQSQGVENDSIAVLTQLTTVSVPDRIMDESEDEDVWKMGEVTPDKMEEIEEKLLYVLNFSMDT